MMMYLCDTTTERSDPSDITSRLETQESLRTITTVSLTLTFAYRCDAMSTRFGIDRAGTLSEQNTGVYI